VPVGLPIVLALGLVGLAGGSWGAFSVGLVGLAIGLAIGLIGLAGGSWSAFSVGLAVGLAVALADALPCRARLRIHARIRESACDETTRCNEKFLNERSFKKSENARSRGDHTNVLDGEWRETVIE